MASFNALSSTKILFSVLLFLFITSSSYSQSVYTPNLHSPNISATTQPNPVQGKLNIIAVMAEFQSDDNRFTSGNGTFGNKGLQYLDNPDISIDPLPHNKEYFEAHLEFAKNYYSHMSNGTLHIEYTVLPEIYKLPVTMNMYSPTGPDPDLSILINLVEDVWKEVERNETMIPVQQDENNTMFIIFHAGVGRDVELTGTTLTKTPEDIPSVYLSKEAMQSFLNDLSFAGFPIQDGDIIVNNSAILPRTLNRPGVDISGNQFVLQLSINGLITAQIGSHLGLPDLFNTDTGESGIGRFGLMDGAGIFSYNGLFPPEMSAWEKMYLGWAVPDEIMFESETEVYLPAVSLIGDDKISKISITNSEYFLVENRHRDPDDIGVELTIQKPDGKTILQTFSNSDTGFTNQSSGFEQLLEPGVVTNVNNFDFSLPGGLDPGPDNLFGTPDDRNLNGGMLIWHIDESVISNKISSNSINNDPDKKGVSLVEADGAQDIGKPINTGFFQNEATGSAFDLWWAGNNASVISQRDTITIYENRFGPDTTPDNQSNTGAPSYFELYDFSENLATASFKIRFANPFSNIYSPVEWNNDKSEIKISPFVPVDDSYWSRYPLALQNFSSESFSTVLIPGHNGIQIFDLDNFSLIEPVITQNSTQQSLILSDKKTVITAEKPGQYNSIISLSSFSYDMNQFTENWTVSTSPNAGFVSRSEPGIIDLDRSSARINLNTGEIITTEKPVQRSESSGPFRSSIEENQLVLEFLNGTQVFSLPVSNDFKRAHTGLIRQGDGNIVFYLLEDEKISVFKPDSDYQNEIIITDNTFIGWPAIVDFDNDGTAEFIFVDKTRNQLIAKNMNGAVLPDFPVDAHGESRFTGTPLVADLTGDGDFEILISTVFDYTLSIAGYSGNLEPINGFPLQVGSILTNNNLPVHPAIIDNKLVAVSPDKDLKIWEFNNIGDVLWPAKYGPDFNNNVSASVISSTQPPQPDELLIISETYNWPNPARDDTNIRFRTSVAATVNIKILTLSGTLIYNKSYETAGSLSEEVEVDTSGWPSGAYFALVEAKTDQRKQQKTIKIAITK